MLFPLYFHLKKGTSYHLDFALDQWRRINDADAIFLAARMPQAEIIIEKTGKAGIKKPILAGTALDLPSHTNNSRQLRERDHDWRWTLSHGILGT